MSERPPFEPYVGARPFALGERLYGRTQDVARVHELLTSERIVLLHSPSGAGKSSLIQAGLTPLLSKHFSIIPIRVGGGETLPGCGLGRFVGNLLTGLNQALPPDKQLPPKELGREPSAREFLERTRDLSGPPFPLLVFDQFEEVVTTDRSDLITVDQFFRQIGELLENPIVWALFAIREDYLGTLEPYIDYVPGALRQRHRLDLLSQTSAIEAICGPLDVRESPAKFDHDAAAELVRRLRLRRNPVDQTEFEGLYIEPVILQVVCTELWQRLFPRGSHRKGRLGIGRQLVTITIDRLPTETMIEDAIVHFYDRVVSGSATADVPESAIRAWAEYDLLDGERRRQVLTGPTKSAHDEPVLKHLVDNYLLRQDVRAETLWYELAHDRMTTAVRRGNDRWQLSKSGDEGFLYQQAKRWAAQGKSPTLLLFGSELKNARKTAGRGDARFSPVKEYLEASVAAWKTRRKARLGAIAGTAAVATIVFIFIIAFARVSARRTVEQATEKANLQLREAQQLVEAATSEARGIRLSADQDIARERQRAASQVKQANQELDRRTGLANKRVEEAQRRWQQAAAETRKAEAETKTALALSEGIMGEVSKLERDLSRSREALDHTSTMQGVNDLLTDAQRTRSLDTALTAAALLAARAEVAREFPVAAAEYRAALTAIYGLYERGLLAQTLDEFDRHVQALSISEGGQCLRYVTAAGEIKNIARGSGSTCPSDLMIDGNEALHDTPLAANPINRSFNFSLASGIAQKDDTIALGSALGYVRIVEDGNISLPFRPHRHEITTAYVSPKSQYLATATSLWKLKVSQLAGWKMEDGKRPKEILHVPARGMFGWFRWWNVFSGDTTHIIKAFAIREGSRPILATARADGALEFYAIETSSWFSFKPPRLLKIPSPLEPDTSETGHSKPATAVAFSANGKLLASGGDDGVVFVWRVPAEAEQWKALKDAGKIPAHARAVPCQAGVTQVQFSPDDSLIVAGCREGTLAFFAVTNTDKNAEKRIQDVLALKQVSSTIDTRTGEVKNLVFDPCRRRLVVSGTELRLEELRVPPIALFERRQVLEQRIHEMSKRETIDKAAFATLVADIRASVPADDGKWDHGAEACATKPGPAK